MSAERHDPTWFHHAREFGRWCQCSCGWHSRNGTISLAQDDFGQHLLAANGVTYSGDSKHAATHHDGTR